MLQIDTTGHHETVIAGVAAAGLLLVGYWIISYIAKDSLRTVPGRIASRWTSISTKIQVLRGSLPVYIDELHQQYGPLVRLGPNEVSITDPAAVKTIYKVGSAFKKSRWYNDFTGLVSTKEMSIFTMTDPKEHAHRRRLQAFNFSEKWLKELESDLSRNVKATMDGMQRETKTCGHFDAFKWCTFMATDVVGEAAFGESFNLLESGKRNQYIEDLEGVAWRGILATLSPFLVHTVLGRLPFGSVAEAGKSGRRIGMYGAQSIHRYQSQWSANKEAVKPTLLTNEYKLVESGVLTQAQICRDATGYIIAGTDTTANTATYIFWELANHPDIQSQVIEAVQRVPEDYTDDDLKHIEVLQHVINETLRICGPAQSSLPRVVPESGLTVCGTYIPRGTIVSTQAYSLHRDPEIWAEPLIFKPSRWANTTNEMRDAFMPFGRGGRVCIGQHFALMELRHALVKFYKAFPRGVEPAFVDGFSPEDMIQVNYFLAQPKGKRCLLRPL